jgi:hypothetical protein
LTPAVQQAAAPLNLADALVVPATSPAPVSIAAALLTPHNPAAAPSSLIASLPTGIAPEVSSPISLGPGVNTIQATPTVLEVGLPAGAAGWVKIRAEAVPGGGVLASVSASTPSGQDVLRHDLPNIAAYLASEHIAVDVQLAHPAFTLAPDVAASAAVTIDGRSFDSSTASSGFGASERDPPQGAANSPPNRNPDQSQPPAPAPPTSGNAIGAIESSEASAAYTTAPSSARQGGWLNVMA